MELGLFYYLKSFSLLQFGLILTTMTKKKYTTLITKDLTVSLRILIKLSFSVARHAGNIIVFIPFSYNVNPPWSLETLTDWRLTKRRQRPDWIAPAGSLKHNAVLGTFTCFVHHGWYVLMLANSSLTNNAVYGLSANQSLFLLVRSAARSICDLWYQLSFCFCPSGDLNNERENTAVLHV